MFDFIRMRVLGAVLIGTVFVAPAFAVADSGALKSGNQSHERIDPENFDEAAVSADFKAWLKDFETRALTNGISERVYRRATADIQFLPNVIKLDRRQPEGRLTFAQYKDKIVNAARVAKGRKLFRQHYPLLQKVSQKFGVQPQYIVALWGIETNFGGFTGGTQTIDALATLAFEGRRREFFSRELINALSIVQGGHITASGMKGSWAGALGQNQFMPSSFLAYAVDYSGDGRKDIWGTLPDVFASSANYLSRSGWKGDQKWGREVKIDGLNIPAQDFGTKVRRPLSYWRELGVRTLSGALIPAVEGMEGTLVQPDGEGTTAYLVYKNYHVLLKWNRSVYFATSVGLIADAIVAP